MRLKDLKDMMLLPDREILLNRRIEVEGTEMLLISITSESGVHKLWTLSRLPEQLSNEEPIREPEQSFSNRELMQQELQNETMIGDRDRFISRMIIQGQSITFHSSQSAFWTDQNPETCMKLQHFIEKGIEFSGFEEAELSRLVLTFYEQDPDEPFPDLDLEQELDITVTFNSTIRRIAVHTEPVVLKFEDSPGETKHYFYDPLHEQKRFFYMNGWTRYDIREEARKKFEQPAEEGVTEEEWQQLNQQYMDSAASICSKDQVLALLEYESEDDIQLNFYAQDYLETKPLPASSMTSTHWFFKSDREVGPHGLKSRVSLIGPVDRMFEGNIVVELMSYYKEFPEKEIKKMKNS